jgi:predicted dehydrogenase
VAVCDAEPGRLRGTAERFEIARLLRDVDEVIGSDELDAVHLGSGIPDHARQTVGVLKSGKHCVCTVPMGRSIAELRAIIGASRAAGKA